MKRLFVVALIGAALAGCASQQPNAQVNGSAPYDPNYPNQPYYGGGTSIGIGVGSWGGRGFGGVGLGVGF